MHRAAWLVYWTGLLLVASAYSASGQSPIPKACIDNLQNNPTELAVLPNTAVCFWELALNGPNERMKMSSALHAQAAVQKNLTSVQAGAPSGSNGTTSAVSQPNTALSLATEYGGITSSTKDQTVTLQTTLAGIPELIAKQGWRPYCWSTAVQIDGCVTSSSINLLNRFGFGITANTSTSANGSGASTGAAQGGAQPVSIAGVGNPFPSFASAFAKFKLYQGKGSKVVPSDPGAVNGLPLAIAQQNLTIVLREPPDSVKSAYSAWHDCFLKQVSDASFSDLPLERKEEIFSRYYPQITAILFAEQAFSCPDPSSGTAAPVTAFPSSASKWQTDLLNALQRFMAATSMFEANVDAFLNKNASTALSLEYDYNTPANQPTNSTLKFIYGQSFHTVKCASNDAGKFKAVSVAANVGASLYNSQPSSSIPDANILRDVQAGAEVDYSICTSGLKSIGKLLGDTTIAAAYYYQDQTSPSILKVTPGQPLDGISFTGLDSSANTIFTQRGPISFAQVKLGLGTGKNVKFPIAISWSNRTELITHRLWSAQFGVSYDFTSLFSSQAADAASGSGSGE